MVFIYFVYKYDLEIGVYLDVNGKVIIDLGEYIYDYEGICLLNNGCDVIVEIEFN